MAQAVCACAELHQTLHESGELSKPENCLLGELHYHSLRRVALGDKAKRGGEAMKLTPSARAVAYVLYSKTSAPAYRTLRALYPWMPRRKKVAHSSAVAKLKPFVASGCHQLEWGQQAFRIMDGVGYSPRENAFLLGFDCAKVIGKLKWDMQRKRWVGQLDFDTRCSTTYLCTLSPPLPTRVHYTPTTFYLLCD